MSLKADELTCILLGQKWSVRDPSIRDYGCNLFADKVAAIDILLEHVKDEKLRKLLQDARSILVRRGTALWIMKSDPLTQLAIRLGVTRPSIDMSKVRTQKG